MSDHATAFACACIFMFAVAIVLVLLFATKSGASGVNFEKGEPTAPTTTPNPPKAPIKPKGERTMMAACARLAEEATTRMQHDAAEQRAHLLVRLQASHDTLVADSTRRDEIQQLTQRVNSTPTPGAPGTDPKPTATASTTASTDSPFSQASKSMSKYDRQKRDTSVWHVALRGFNDQAAALGVHVRPAVKPRLHAVGGERCEDLPLSKCNAEHCSILSSSSSSAASASDTPKPETVCASIGRTTACWITPPTRADAWSQCVGPTSAKAGVAFDDEHYAAHPVSSAADCDGRLQWWAAKCRWKKGEAKNTVYGGGGGGDAAGPGPATPVGPVAGAPAVVTPAGAPRVGGLPLAAPPPRASAASTKMPPMLVP
jgi:hypothetical protein